jgi:hypothetical protein
MLALGDQEEGQVVAGDAPHRDASVSNLQDSVLDGLPLPSSANHLCHLLYWEA